MQLNINSDAVKVFSRKLEKMHRSALPSAIRGAINKAAFDVKGGKGSDATMQKYADQSFVKRQPNFFKANSKVEPAKGFNISSMKSTVGFLSEKLQGGNNFSIKDLEQQENGGNIDGRSFVPLNAARTGAKKNVKKEFRIADIKSKVVDSKESKGKNNKEKFIRAAIHAGEGGFIIGNFRNGKGNRFMFKINYIVKIGKEYSIGLSAPLYAVQGNRTFAPPATHFMQKASQESAGKIEYFYIKEAERQIQKFK